MNSKVLIKNAHFRSLTFDTCHASFDNQAYQIGLFLEQLFNSQVCFLSVFIRKVAAKLTAYLFDLMDRKAAVYLAVVLKLTFETPNC
ncbi:MAG: hypothetical protein HRT58_10055 [Crocinitomicaceae bacterium]|nr:hypothetical protein [Flavobacteriales bacterium]NQZ35997.1 hypothetical protein [Crocinitomicaceae bacterium]